MDKQHLREQLWDDLEDSGEARFPFPPHGRIPNFAGADAAAERLAETTAWERADVIKANPDAPQLPVRRAALRAGKTVYMAVPRLRDEQCFLRLDPAEIDDIDHATTVGGSAEVGVPVHPDAVDPIDLIVAGSVVVTPAGGRIGKGEGYSDLEYAILSEFDLVDDETVTVTTVHEMQVTDATLSFSPHDVFMDLIVTPERVLETTPDADRPAGIDWDELGDDQRAEIPILETLE
ncbi:5-formyltetrahydrofolate cyclo-ligase [Natronolimnobius baerhuensis]|uniref:5-formyltetrahydrofolate cyclo-ligase n=1 Tax=Natronolimnobius baerhuensis TaxID=253108 RepID=A0A202E9B6_9EURY|nr:5-formyltetrahydrofolate cyclo-ligase [Natronolimnobius baerhuensis]OVE84851.1 5-formyltetrahydrofolate cyclo-ligase [Natronolimnobius baerhuensis]